MIEINQSLGNPKKHGHVLLSSKFTTIFLLNSVWWSGKWTKGKNLDSVWFKEIIGKDQETKKTRKSKEKQR